MSRPYKSLVDRDGAQTFNLDTSFTRYVLFADVVGEIDVERHDLCPRGILRIHNFMLTSGRGISSIVVSKSNYRLELSVKIPSCIM